MRGRHAGDQVTFGTVLLMGGVDWTYLGKPVIPNARVKCTVEQQTLCRETLVFKFKRRLRYSKFWRVRNWVTVLRVDEICYDADYEQPPAVKPLRLLDIWANRWLQARELEKIPLGTDGRPA